jgi:hypothetical protein
MHNIGLFWVFWLFILLLTNQNGVSIKPRISQTPPCYECKFYKPLSYGKYDTSGKCGLYIKVYDDILQYEYADVARQNKKKCGENGTDFQPKIK